MRLRDAHPLPWPCRCLVVHKKCTCIQLLECGSVCVCVFRPTVTWTSSHALPPLCLQLVCRSECSLLACFSLWPHTHTLSLFLYVWIVFRPVFCIALALCVPVWWLGLSLDCSVSGLVCGCLYRGQRTHLCPILCLLFVSDACVWKTCPPLFLSPSCLDACALKHG